MTVLFADLVGSTELATRQDPEHLRSMLAAFLDEMREEILGFGGSVEKYAGDAIMAVFGVPRVNEDDAERAVRAALAMRESLEQLRAHAGPRAQGLSRTGHRLPCDAHAHRGRPTARDPRSLVARRRARRGDARREGDQWIATGDVNRWAIPATLRGVLAARIDALPVEAKRALQRGAVVGRFFTHQTLQALSAGDDDLERALAQLLRADLIRESGRDPERRYPRARGSLHVLFLTTGQTSSAVFWPAQDAIGAVGARGVGALEFDLLDALKTGLPRCVANVDGSRVVNRVDPFVGAHCDVYHDEIAMLVLLGAGLLRVARPGPGRGR